MRGWAEANHELILVQNNRFIAVYSHWGMVAPAFAQGEGTVAAGEKLGVVGRTGATVGTHVYFEMLVAGKPVDPAPYLHVSKCDREARPPSACFKTGSHGRLD
jgi:Peptidase family M23